MYNCRFPLDAEGDEKWATFRLAKESVQAGCM